MRSGGHPRNMVRSTPLASIAVISSGGGAGAHFTAAGIAPPAVISSIALGEPIISRLVIDALAYRVETLHFLITWQAGSSKWTQFWGIDKPPPKKIRPFLVFSFALQLPACCFNAT